MTTNEEQRNRERRAGDRRETDRRTGDQGQENRRREERRQGDRRTGDSSTYAGPERRSGERRSSERREEDRRTDDRRTDERREGERRSDGDEDDAEGDLRSGGPHERWDPRMVDAVNAAEIGPEKPGQIDSSTLHHGRVVHLSLDTVRFPDGSTGELELIRHSGAAAVVPVLGDADGADPEIVLLRQFRYAAGGDIYEIPAGRPDRAGEPWEDVARRELEEETGYVARSLRRLNTIYTTPGFTDERIHAFLATDLSRGRTNLDDDEFLQVITRPLSAVLDAIRDGAIIDAKSVSALLYYARFATES